MLFPCLASRLLNLFLNFGFLHKPSTDGTCNLLYVISHFLESFSLLCIFLGILINLIIYLIRSVAFKLSSNLKEPCRLL